MNLVSLEYFLTYKNQNMDLNALLSQKIETIFFAMTRCILLYVFSRNISFQSKHSGRKLQWHHHMSNGTITLSNPMGKYDLDVTTFQMAVLFCWENRRYDSLTLENLRLATAKSYESFDGKRALV